MVTLFIYLFECFSDLKRSLHLSELISRRTFKLVFLKTACGMHAKKIPEIVLLWSSQWSPYLLI